jgi:hypothetical protein
MILARHDERPTVLVAYKLRESETTDTVEVRIGSRPGAPACGTACSVAAPPSDRMLERMTVLGRARSGMSGGFATTA